MGKAFIVGVGMTKFDKPGIKTDGYPMWVKEATVRALADAKTAYEEIEQVFVCYCLEETGSGQRAMQELGLTGVPIYNINSACASGSAGIYLAKDFIELGRNDCVLVAGFEKMEKRLIWPQYLDRSCPIHNFVNALSKLTEIDAMSGITPQIFGYVGVEHMKRYGTTVETLAKVAYKNRKHGVNNPYAQFQKEYTIQEILDSPKVYGPLTRLQCCPTTCGAAAVVVASEHFVKEHNLESQAVEILGMEMVTDKPDTFSTTSSFPIAGYNITREAVQRLLRHTNKSLDDVQVIELHDSFSSYEILMYEAIGLCPPGGATEFIERGDNTYGGKYVINPSGGLTSKGHPFGATGIAQCIELCWQLRGEAGKRQVPDARLALHHNIGLGTAVMVALYQKGKFS